MPGAGNKRKGVEAVLTGAATDGSGSPSLEGDAAAASGPRVMSLERTVKRRRIDPNAIMCPFELNGVCNDDDCR